MTDLKKVILEINPMGIHSKQILAGFSLLEEKKKLRLKVKENTELPNGLAIAEIAEKKIIYDTLDHADIFFEDELKECDYYFKRSFQKIYADKQGKNIRPLGFNYWVDNKFRYQANPRILIEYIIRKILKKDNIIHNYKKFEDLPNLKNGKYEAILLTNLYDPKAKEVENKQKEEEREKINKFRIECIEALRKSYPDKVLAGVKDSIYAQMVAKQYILPKNITKKDNFISIMQSTNICICTKGLHNSNGWRLAEAIASSKCIVTEPLYNEVTGKFEKDKNYYEFRTPEELVEIIGELINNKKKILDMMNKNYEYYNNYLRPDVLILNTIREFL